MGILRILGEMLNPEKVLSPNVSQKKPTILCNGCKMANVHRLFGQMCILHTLSAGPEQHERIVKKSRQIIKAAVIREPREARVISVRGRFPSSEGPLGVVPA
jgi:hypothetical protein